jgi:ABC-type spermidine/putrescine transport system permease subunit II
MKVFSKGLFFLIIIFLMIPIATMLIWSFFSNWQSGFLLPKDFTLDGFKYFFMSGDYIIAVKSTLFSISIAIISVILSITLSRFLIKSTFIYKLQLESLFYFPMLLPVVSISMGSHKMFLGLNGGLDGVVITILHIYFSLPYAFKIVYSCYLTWGMEYENIGRELGASEIKAFFFHQCSNISKGIYVVFYNGFCCFIFSIFYKLLYRKS